MKILIILMFSQFIVSCSKLNIALNLAPRYVTSQVDGAFDFKSEKLSKLRKQIEIDIQNSKKEIAKLLLAHLEMIETVFLVNQPTIESLTEVIDELSVTQTALIKAFQSSVELTVADISEDEAEYFKKHTDNKFSDEIELSANKVKFLNNRKSSFLKTFEFLLDDLSNEQEKMITDFVTANLDYLSQRILVRQSYSLSFYQKLKLKEPMLDFTLTQYQGKKLVAMGSDQKKYFMRLIQFQVEFWKTVNEPQKKYFKKLIENYKEELRKIAI